MPIEVEESGRTKGKEGEQMKKLESFEILNGGKGIKINDLDLGDYPITRLRTEATELNPDLTSND